MSRKTPQKNSYDIIVVGGGTAGLPLAIAAADAGARVLIIERAPVLGGTLQLTRASAAAAGTSFQKERGITDSADWHYEDIMRASLGTADPVLTRVWVDHAAAAIAWLSQRGIEFDFLPVVAHGQEEPFRVPRALRIKGMGKALFATFDTLIQKAVASGRVAVKLNSRVVSLLRDAAGGIRGVAVESEGASARDAGGSARGDSRAPRGEGVASAPAAGALEYIEGRQIVLTTGGCMANPSLFEDLHTIPLYWAAGPSTVTGDGLQLGRAAGGRIAGGDDYIPVLGVVMADDRIPSVPLGKNFEDTMINGDAHRRPPWEIWVNSRAERFVQEDNTAFRYRERLLGRQPGHLMWLLHDQQAMEQGPSPLTVWDKAEYAAAFQDHPLFTQAGSLRALALKASLDPNALSATVADYNHALEREAPDRLGRLYRPAPLVKPPYYAVRMRGYHLFSPAGLQVDDHLRVVRVDGTPVNNLYAAGEILGATAVGGSARVTGSMITAALSLGLLLGKTLATRS